jgi:hypothetical protein
MKITIPARRQGKSDMNLKLVGMFIEQNKELYLGSNDVNSLHDRIKAAYPDAKLSKHKGYVLVEKSE